jgi:hypothetical protein
MENDDPRLLYGRKLADAMLDEVAGEVKALKEAGIEPF